MDDISKTISLVCVVSVILIYSTEVLFMELSWMDLGLTVQCELQHKLAAVGREVVLPADVS